MNEKTVMLEQVREFRRIAHLSHDDRHRQMRSDKHLKPIENFIKSVCDNKNIECTNRPNCAGNLWEKRLDLLISGNRGIEIKSIGASFDGNYKSRIEEMCGQGFLAKKALGLKYFDYIFIVNEYAMAVNGLSRAPMHKRRFGSPKEYKIKRLRDMASLAIENNFLDNFIEITIDAKGNVSYYKGLTITNLIEKWNEN